MNFAINNKTSNVVKQFYINKIYYLSLEQLLTYGLYNNELKHISEAENGLACNCYCPNCKHPLVAKNNPLNHKIAHFAHHSGKECAGAVETALHLLAKSVLLKTKRLKTPKYHFDYDPQNEQSIFRPARELIFDKIILERLIDVNGEKIIPDAIGIINGREVYIEFANTHFIDEYKKSKLLKSGVACIEINLKGQILEEKNIADFLINDTPQKYWIINTRYDEAYKEYKILEEKRKEYEVWTNKNRAEQHRIENENKIIKYRYSKEYQILKTDEWGSVANCPMKKVELKKFNTTHFYRHLVLKQIIDGAFWNGEFYGRLGNGRFIYLNKEKIVVFPPDNIPVTEKEIKSNKFLYAGLLELLPVIKNTKFGDCINCKYLVDEYYITKNYYSVCGFLQ